MQGYVCYAVMSFCYELCCVIIWLLYVPFIAVLLLLPFFFVWFACDVFGFCCGFACKLCFVLFVIFVLNVFVFFYCGEYSLNFFIVLCTSTLFIIEKLVRTPDYCFVGMFALRSAVWVQKLWKNMQQTIIKNYKSMHKKCTTKINKQTTRIQQIIPMINNDITCCSVTLAYDNSNNTVIHFFFN